MNKVVATGGYVNAYVASWVLYLFPKIDFSWRFFVLLHFVAAESMTELDPSLSVYTCVAIVDGSEKVIPATPGTQTFCPPVLSRSPSPLVYIA